VRATASIAPLSVARTPPSVDLRSTASATLTALAFGSGSIPQHGKAEFAEGWMLKRVQHDELVAEAFQNQCALAGEGILLRDLRGFV
jgi:hypothetical protein